MKSMQAAARTSRRRFLKAGGVTAAGGLLAYSAPRLTVAQQKVSLSPGETISGEVLDCREDPLEGATVTHGANTIVTGPDGAYALPFDPSDPYLVTSASGFVAQNRLIANVKSVPQTVIWPNNYDVGLDVNDDGIPDVVGPPFAPVAQSTTELTPAQLASFANSHPEFASLRAHAHSLGHTSEGTAWHIDSLTQGVGLSMLNPSTGRLLMLLHVPPDPVIGTVGFTSLAGSDAPNTISFFNAVGTQYSFDVEKEQIFVAISEAPGSFTIAFSDIDNAPKVAKDKKEKFAKWLKEESGLSAFWVKIILVSYIALIFSPAGWVCCFFTLWVIADELEACKKKACE